MNLKLFPQAIILVSVPAIFQLVFVFTLAGLLKQSENETAREMRSREVVAGADHMTKLLQQCGIALYAFKNSKAPESLEQFRTDSAAFLEEINHLRPLVAGRPDENATLDKIVTDFGKAKDFGELLARGINRGVDYDAMQAALEQRETILSVSNSVLKSLRQLTELERDSAKRMKSQSPATRRLIWNCLIVGVVGNIVLALFLARLFYKGTSSRLDTLVDNTKRMAKGEPLKPALTGGDEIAQLDNVFHSMAAAVTEASRKERAVLENTSDAICSININTVFLSANPASREVFGFTPAELIGKNLSDVVHGDDWAVVRTALKTSRESGRPISFDSRVRRADSKQSDIHWSVHWSESEERYFCVAHDISERKRLELMKQDFVSMVSHDLRTPLMSVQADIDLLSAESKDVPQLASDKLSSATRNIKYVITLINSLLDIERMDADKLEVQLALTRLQNVFDRALDAVLPLSQKKQITLECDSTEHIVMADENRLAQVLINLISNALKFSDQNTCIKIQVKESVDEIEIRVIDQGRGIPKSKLDSIFGRFEQVEVADSTMKGGAGLGLAICKRIIEEHQGSIGVDSQEGRGSEFWIRLPA